MICYALKVSIYSASPNTLDISSLPFALNCSFSDVTNETSMTPTSFIGNGMQFVIVWSFTVIKPLDNCVGIKLKASIQ